MHAIHPGFFIKKELNHRNWNQRDLAFVLGCREQVVTMLVSCKRGISPKMSKSLGAAFDVPCDMFLNLQLSYDLEKAKEPNPAIKERAEKVRLSRVLHRKPES